MRAGKLDRRVQILDPVESQSGSGEVTVTYEPATGIGAGDGKVWAQILPLAGAKYFAADAVNSRVTHTIRVRRQAGFRTNQRVRHEPEPGKFQELDVEAVLEIATDRRHVALMCVLRESEGWR